MDKHLDRLEGEDAFICNSEDVEKLVFICRMIEESASTVIVVTFDSREPNGHDMAVMFLRDIELNLSKTAIPRRFFAMPKDEWQRFFDMHRHERFAITPSILDNSEKRFGEKAFEDFADIPNTQSSLADVAEIFACPSTNGVWPVVLLTGETGSGKTFAARRIFEELKKAKCLKGEFVTVNCGEFGKDDMNAVLFGIEGGHFTDVRKDKPGAIELAADGILFLDEIGTLPLDLQPRLLGFLDKGEYRRHGAANADRKSSSRFIFGTNEDLHKALSEGRLRFDLYNRINGMRVRMPSVAERIGGANGGKFLERTVDGLCRQRGIIALTRNAKAIFAMFAHKHPWKGNFRELERFFNILQREVLIRGERNVVSAAMMQNVIVEFSREIEIDGNMPVADGGLVSVHPLLKDISGIYARDKATLEFAFKCAATSKNCNQAAKRFFAGKSQSNPQGSFIRWLGRFGFAYDDNSEGHIVRIGKDDI